MKKCSLKFKLTILYTLFMTLLTCISLGIIFSLSNQEVLSSVRSDLEKQVYQSLDEVKITDGEIDIDSDFYDLEDGVYLSIYNSDGKFLFGRLPYSFNSVPEFREGEIQTIQDTTTLWYVFDTSCTSDYPETLYIRGITSVTKAENSMRITQHFALILLPLLVFLTAILGYLFTRHTLMPVRQITETVQNIRKDEDLSQRVGLGRGTDEIYHLSETFDQMLEQIEASFLREKRFTSDVSHELRTPVSVILAQCDEMLTQDNLSEAQIQQISRIKRKADEMAQMISRLLTLSRADQGRQKLQLEYLNLSELTEMTAEEQQILAEERNINILTDIEPDIYAWVDESFYIRLLVNLISNAIYYNRENGYVKIALSQKREKIICSIEDNGIGIASEHLPHIWERFYRIDSSRTNGSHSGLGLSMVQWIVKAHGGTISADSCPGKGSCFTFSLFRKKNVF